MPRAETTSPAPRRTLAVWLASGLGVGLVAPAPGTFGALWGLPLAWGYEQLPGAAGYWTATILMLLVGVPLCNRAANDLAMKDPGPVVWDEFTTVPLAFTFVQFNSVWVALAGFGLHRLFDITKPWPCKRLENLPGGWGIMMDDVAAGLYAGLTLWGMVWVVNWSAGG